MPQRLSITSPPQGPAAPSSPLIRRLEAFSGLTDADRAALIGLGRQPGQAIEARRDLIREGDEPKCIYLMVEGWACLYRGLRDGRVQIVDFAVPGDLCDLNVFMLDRMDHSVRAISRLRVVEIGSKTLNHVLSDHPNIATALWRQELVSKSIQREWTLNVGRRTALERIAHLFCEMFLRLQAAGLTDGCSCRFPPTQTDLADATGLTSVHVNRTLQELRQLGLIILEGRRLTIPDMAALQEAGLFNAAYLHRGRLNALKDQARAKAAGGPARAANGEPGRYDRRRYADGPRISGAARGGSPGTGSAQA